MTSLAAVGTGGRPADVEIHHSPRPTPRGALSARNRICLPSGAHTALPAPQTCGWSRLGGPPKVGTTYNSPLALLLISKRICLPSDENRGCTPLRATSLGSPPSAGMM